MLNENELKVGDKIVYNGLGSDRKGTIIKRTKATSIIVKLTIKMQFSTIEVKYCKDCPAIEIGLRLDND